MDKRIAFFDSGVGGLTVLHQCMQRFSAEHYLYISDSENAPYGYRGAEEITKLTTSAIDQANINELKAIVIACNTATSAAITTLRMRYPIPVIGMEPAIKPALAKSDTRRIMVLATPFTLANRKFKDLILQLDAQHQIDAAPAIELVDFAEEFDFDSYVVTNFVKRLIKSIEWENYHTLVLGCTHFLYFKNLIFQHLPIHVSLIDGNEGTINELNRRVPLDNGLQKGSLECLISGSKMNAEILMPYMHILDKGMRSYQCGF